MAENVLEKIIEKKSEKIVNLKKTISLESLDELINTNKTFVDFKEKIQNNLKESKFSIIAEIKKASPFGQLFYYMVKFLFKRFSTFLFITVKRFIKSIRLESFVCL